MIKALSITGPTASGKTALSLSVAERFDCEIISLDSMQIYKGMDIGTAKATESERGRVPHHMLDVISPRECYNTECYRRDALLAARDIVERGKLPLFVGGTGLYIDTLMRATPKSPESDSVISSRLMAEGESEEGRARLYARLTEIDPESAEKTHANNLRRVVRALEIYELTGKTKSYFDRMSREGEPDVSGEMITLDFHDRENLYGRVEKRVDIMIKEGLIDEVRDLYSRGELVPGTTAASAIGYKELLSYIEGTASLLDACRDIKLATRRYAKRQLTWFRHNKDAHRLFIDTEDGRMKSEDELVSEVLILAEKLIQRVKNT